MVKVVFVCFANTCRSVALQTVFSELIKNEGLENTADVISRGLSKDIRGDPIDGNMKEFLSQRGYESTHTSKTLTIEDLISSDYIIVVSKDLKVFLKGMLVSENDKKKIHLATDFSSNLSGQCIKDPYASGFDQCIDMVEECAKGLLNVIKEKL